MSKKIDDLLAAEGDAAERTPTPDAAAGGRRGRSVVFSVRLNPDELAELQRYAEERELPARTLVRSWILDRLHSDARDDLSRRVERLEQEVFRRTA